MGTGAAYWPPRCSEELYLRPLPWFCGFWGVGERQARGCLGAQGSQKFPMAGVGGTGHANTSTPPRRQQRGLALCAHSAAFVYFSSQIGSHTPTAGFILIPNAWYILLGPIFTSLCPAVPRDLAWFGTILRPDFLAISGQCLLPLRGPRMPLSSQA